LWGHLAEEYEDDGQFEKSEDAYNHALELLERSPDTSKEYAVALDNLGSLYIVWHKSDAAERCRGRALKLREATGDPLEIARGKSLMSEVYLMEHKFKEAERTAAEAFDAMVSLRETDSEIIATLITLTFASAMHGQHAYAVERGREAKSLALSRLPADSLLTGEVRMALGYAEWKAGIAAGPDEEMREGVRILRKWATPGHPSITGALTMYANYLRETHRKDEAREVAEEAKALTTKPTNGCVNCTVSVYGLRSR